MNPRPIPCQGGQADLKHFRDFLEIDQGLRPRTVSKHYYYLQRLQSWLKRPVETATTEDLRAFLKSYKSKAPQTYADVLKTLKVFYRDYLQKEELVKSFSFPTIHWEPKAIPTKEDLQRFYSTLNNDRDKALFLVYATSGLRNGEVLSLSRDIDFATRALIPRNHSGKTKFAWVSFFNDETETVLRKYLASRKDNDSRLFLLEGNDSVVRIFKRASDRSGIKLTPQDLRAWFADEMDRLGVPEKYIDSFQGRIPKSVLRRNYSQYSLERLREVYDKARLTVLA